MRWNVAVILVAFLFTFVHSFIVSYGTGFSANGYGSSLGFESVFGLTYLVDFIYFMDMFVKARTVTYDHNDGMFSFVSLLFEKFDVHVRITNSTVILLEMNLYLANPLNENEANSILHQ